VSWLGVHASATLATFLILEAHDANEHMVELVEDSSAHVELVIIEKRTPAADLLLYDTSPLKYFSVVVPPFVFDNPGATVSLPRLDHPAIPVEEWLVQLAELCTLTLATTKEIDVLIVNVE
jgi:hypothetical protein